MNINTQVSDARLVEMAISGELGAFDVLVKRFQKAVHAAAFAVVADREASLDVIQETFIAAYRQLHMLDDGSRFGSWVCGIARNQAKRARHTRYRYASHELPLPEGNLIPQTPQTDTLAQSIRDALACLTEMQADVVTLFYMEGYSIVECAELLGVPQGTIKRRLYDARQRLKREMIDTVKEHLKEFALPEDYRVIIDNPSRLPSNRTTLCWFKDRWVMVWQDGIWWGPERWRCDTFEYWLSESINAKTWSEPRRIEFAEFPDSDALTFHLSRICVFRDRLYLHTYRHGDGIDLYSSDDLVNWTAHPRLCIPAAGRSDLFADDNSLYVTYPSWIQYEDVQGDRVDIMRSTDGGNTWRWLRSPAWPMKGITDAAGLAYNGCIYIAWRDHDPGSNRPLDVHMIRSDDGGYSWNDPVTIESFTLTQKASWALRISASNDTLVIAQEVWDDPGSGNSEIWMSFSHDEGKTWSDKASYSHGNLLDPAIAFAPDGTLVIAGSSRIGDESRPWVVHSHITP